MKLLSILTGILFLAIISLVPGCKNRKQKFADTPHYTCPMHPQVISEKPGKCPVCGMDLVKIGQSGMYTDTTKPAGYSCPMHPQVKSDSAGTCPICGMQLEREKLPSAQRTVSLSTLLKPANQQVVASVPMVHMQKRGEDIEMETYGFITYDPRYKGTVSANVNGRIEKLYVKYRYQEVEKGQKIMDIYSPELLTAQENLLFILKNDSGNVTLIEAAKQKLLLLGMSKRQLETIIQNRQTQFTVSVYSNYSGHIHDSGNPTTGPDNAEKSMNDVALTTQALKLKEGMYVQKGQPVFAVFNAEKAWAILNIFAGQSALVKKGDKVRITPETDPAKDFQASVSYIEPYFEKGSKTQTVRIYFDNTKMKLPIGSQVKATIFAGDRYATWLPEEAVLSLGIDKVVFVRTDEAFRARKVETGIVNKHLIQILSGLDKSEAVAANAQYLVDSESFIKTND
jgi:Cu(I)/Ag(I) efflux system membrane fusion protein